MTRRAPKAIRFATDARRALFGGVQHASLLADVCFGPIGGSVAIDAANDYPEITRDGFTALRDLGHSRPFERVGVELVKEMVSRLHYSAGDGTATAVLLARALCAEAIRLEAAGYDGGQIKGGFEQALEAALEGLLDLRRMEVDRAMLVGIARRAGGDDRPLAELLAEAIERVGAEGLVKISYSQSISSDVEYTSGMQFESVALNRAFLADDGSERALQRPLLLMSEEVLDSADAVIPALEIARAQSRSLLVVAEAIVGQALAVLLANNRSNVVLCAAVKGPGSGFYRWDMTADIAVLCGGTVFAKRLGRTPSAARPEDLGACEYATVGSRWTRIHEGAGPAEAVQGRVAQLRDGYARETKHYDRGKLAMRLARLSAGVAHIRVGGFTELEWKDRRLRAERMHAAALGAVAEGVVPSCGVALLRATEAVERVARADPILMAFARAMQAPFRRLSKRLGLDAEHVVADLRRSNLAAGFDPITRSIVPDAFAAQLVDPWKVVVGALHAATSLAAQYATVGCAIAPARAAVTNHRAVPRTER